MRNIFVLIFLMIPIGSGAVAYNGAVLQGVDKITGRISTLEVPLNSPTSFGTLKIEVLACDKTPPEETPEKTAFLVIHDKNRETGAEAEVFRGWMFASSPAISALEHQVYDVWVKDCMSQPSLSSSE